MEKNPSTSASESDEVLQNGCVSLIVFHSRRIQSGNPEMKTCLEGTIVRSCGTCHGFSFLLFHGLGVFHTAIITKSGDSPLTT